jgi:hypothetical protein
MRKFIFLSLDGASHMKKLTERVDSNTLINKCISRKEAVQTIVKWADNKH